MATSSDSDSDTSSSSDNEQSGGTPIEAKINYDPTLKPGEQYLEVLPQSGGKGCPDPRTFRKFDIFIDGSTSDQAKTVHKKHLRRAGIGIYHPASGTRIGLPFGIPNPTNNRAEYLAAITALNWVDKVTNHLSLKEQAKIEVVLYTDSNLLLKSMTIWIKGWKRRGWKKSDGDPVKNKELLVQLDQLISNRFPKTKWVKVKAHRAKPPKSLGKHTYWLWKGNDEADRLAKEGRRLAEQA
jgi:ribonuclease HI